MNAADDAALTERLRVNELAEESDADAEPSASLSLVAPLVEVTCKLTAADVVFV